MEGNHGLISKTGVPSKASIPLTCMNAPSTLCNLITAKPIELGLLGDLVAKSPNCLLLFGGLTEECQFEDMCI